MKKQIFILMCIVWGVTGTLVFAEENTTGENKSSTYDDFQKMKKDSDQNRMLLPIFMAGNISENVNYWVAPFLLSGFVSCEKKHYLKKGTQDDDGIVTDGGNAWLLLPLLSGSFKGSRVYDAERKNEKFNYLFILPLLSSRIDTGVKDLGSGKYDRHLSKINLLGGIYDGYWEKHYYDENTYLYGLFRFKKVYEKWEAPGDIETIFSPHLFSYVKGTLPEYRKISLGPWNLIAFYEKKNDGAESTSLLWRILYHSYEDKTEKLRFFTPIIGYGTDKDSNNVKLKLFYFIDIPL